MANEWYYTKNGERKGPVSADGLRLLAQTGQLGPNDNVWKNGMAQWVPAKTINGLFSTTTPPDPAAVPPSTPLPAKSAGNPVADKKLPEKAQRFISSFRDRWLGLSTKTKAVAVGAVALVGVSLFGCVLCSGWMLFGGKTESPKLVDNPAGKRNKNLDDVIAKRNKNLDDVTGKRNQKLDDIIAMRNKKLGETSPPSDTSNGPAASDTNKGKGGGSDQAIYQRGYDEGYSLGKLYAGRLAAMDAASKREFTQVYQQELQTHEGNLRQLTQAYGKDHPQVMAKMGFCNGLRTALAQAK